jgi:hypothetical protein
VLAPRAAEIRLKSLDVLAVDSDGVRDLCVRVRRQPLDNPAARVSQLRVEVAWLGISIGPWGLGSLLHLSNILRST